MQRPPAVRSGWGKPVGDASKRRQVGLGCKRRRLQGREQGPDLVEAVEARQRTHVRGESFVQFPQRAAHERGLEARRILVERHEEAVTLVRSGIGIGARGRDRRTRSAEEARELDLLFEPRPRTQARQREGCTSDHRRGLEVDEHVRPVPKDPRTVDRKAALARRVDHRAKRTVCRDGDGPNRTALL